MNYYSNAGCTGTLTSSIPYSTTTCFQVKSGFAFLKSIFLCVCCLFTSCNLSTHQSFGSALLHFYFVANHLNTSQTNFTQGDVDIGDDDWEYIPPIIHPPPSVSTTAYPFSSAVTTSSKVFCQAGAPTMKPAFYPTVFPTASVYEQVSFTVTQVKQIPFFFLSGFWFLVSGFWFLVFGFCPLFFSNVSTLSIKLI